MELPSVRPWREKSPPPISGTSSRNPSTLQPVAPIQTTVITKRSRPLIPVAPIELPGLTRILDFDIETIAAGFDDPQFVPQKATCVAWSWIGEDPVESRICTPDGLFGRTYLRRHMLEALLEQIRQADMVTGHNIERFDLPVINAECMRLGIEPIKSVLAQDTIRLYRSKGFKKGQDNIGMLFKVPTEKMALNWQQWQDAYAEDGWETLRQRCESDVLMNKQMRQELINRGYLREPRMWRAGR